MTTITPDLYHTHTDLRLTQADEEIVFSAIEIWRPLLVTLLIVRDAVTSERLIKLKHRLKPQLM